MADTPIDPLPYDRLDTAIARLRYIIIALLIVMIAGLVFLGVQVTRANGRIDQLAGKVDGLDTALGVKFEAVNAKVELDLTAAGCRAQDDGSRDHGTDQSYSQKRHLATTARNRYRRQRNRYRRPYNRSPRPCHLRKADGNCLGHSAAASILEVKKFADVVQVEEGKRSEETDEHRRCGTRTPFQPPGQEPHHRRRPLDERRVAFSLGHPIVEGGMPAGQHLLRIRQVPHDR